MNARSVSGLLRAVFVILALGLGPAHAGPIPTLTADGISLGFTLTTIVSGLPTNNGNSFDVLGSAVNSDGNIILNAAADSGGNRNYVFKDLDNQTAADALGSSAFSGFASALAYSNGSVWASALGGRLVKLNNDGSINTVYDGTSGNPNINANQGLWANPVDGHLLAGNWLRDIDVSGASPSQTDVNTDFLADGLTVSPDGRFVYGSSGQIVDLTTNLLVAGGFGSVSGADGMGVISSPSDPDLDGDLIVNTTTGNIVLVDHITFTQTIIASGGGYGDYASPDRTDGSLLVSSSNNLLRLTCGDDCGIGTPPPSVPEPPTYALMLAALALAAWIGRRRRA